MKVSFILLKAFVFKYVHYKEIFCYVKLIVDRFKLSNQVIYMFVGTFYLVYFKKY